jgi:hypothetical protein
MVKPPLSLSQTPDALIFEKDAPISCAVELAGHILCRSVLGGLHHEYVRI